MDVHCNDDAILRRYLFLSHDIMVCTRRDDDIVLEDWSLCCTVLIPVRYVYVRSLWTKRAGDRIIANGSLHNLRWKKSGQRERKRERMLRVAKRLLNRTTNVSRGRKFLIWETFRVPRSRLSKLTRFTRIYART